MTVALRSFVDTLTFGVAVAVGVLLVLALGMCVALILDYVRHDR